MKKIYITICIYILGNTFQLFSENSSIRFLNQTISETSKSMERLSSGTLLWTDSPSSKAIYEKLESHIRFLAQSIRNNQDMISYYRTREGFLESTGNSLQRIRELIVQRSNSLYGEDEREIIDSEIFMQYSGILKDLSRAQFNTIPIFGDWLKDEEIEKRFREANFYNLSGIDRIMEAVLSERASIGALINTLEHKGAGLAVEQENASAFQSRGDTDFALELSIMKRNEILFFADLFLLRQE
ncbi:flagellin [Spirochaeta isovalerica]|uniref:Flagellin n=1 Tax=Spirochaeta isovalerica TaxID=150 RepID=A0A841RFT7_9SPIO|nr:flagellin [Spirochaeta isovalerica]MBB6481860.1 flagellin [Spirochaeta isovalerica]